MAVMTLRVELTGDQMVVWDIPDWRLCEPAQIAYAGPMNENAPPSIIEALLRMNVIK